MHEVMDRDAILVIKSERAFSKATLLKLDLADQS
jgi:hypothetical protein